MQSPLSPLRQRTSTDEAGAFTLVELLAVMAIILVLAGLILSVAAHANYKGSLARAKAEVASLSSSIENYKVDNGAYPRNSDTDQLNALVDFDPVNGTRYKKASAYLYQELSGLHLPVNGKIVVTKAYATFQPNQLDIAPNAPASVTTRTPTSAYMMITDPFGFAYGYSTAYLKAAEDVANTPGTAPATGQGYNPTFDLWSTAGYSANGGKGTPTSGPSASPYIIYSGLWLKNW